MTESLCIAQYFQRLLHSTSRGVNCRTEEYFSLLFASPDLQKRFLSRNIGELDLQKWRDDFERLIQKGVKFTFPGHPDYPRALTNMDFAPMLLSYVGTPAWNDQKCLAVVGSREATTLSLAWMEEHLSEWIKGRQGIVVSGGARGIDQKAHELCLRLGQPTIAFLPSGLGQIYPPSFRSWQEEIIAIGGALVSEYSFDQEIRKHFFQARNRLISGVSVCCLVIQAARRSGTLITAKQSLEQSRPVLIVPSHPLDVSHRGGLDLLIEGATMVSEATDLNIIFAAEQLSFMTDVPANNPLVGPVKPVHH